MNICIIYKQIIKVQNMKTFQQYLREVEENITDSETNEVDPTQRVKMAFETLKDTDPTYYDNVFRQRSKQDNKAAGSVYDMSTSELKAKILSANWEEYYHPSINPPAVGFVSYDLEGTLGILDLKKAASKKIISYNDKVSFTDPKNTGFAYAIVSASRGDNTHVTVALLGPHPKNSKEVVWTFHPGEPITENKLPLDLVGQTMTVQEAIEKGIQFAKVV